MPANVVFYYQSSEERRCGSKKSKKNKSRDLGVLVTEVIKKHAVSPTLKKVCEKNPVRIQRGSVALLFQDVTAQEYKQLMDEKAMADPALRVALRQSLSTAETTHLEAVACWQEDLTPPSTPPDPTPQLQFMDCQVEDNDEGKQLNQTVIHLLKARGLRSLCFTVFCSPTLGIPFNLKRLSEEGIIGRFAPSFINRYHEALKGCPDLRHEQKQDRFHYTGTKQCILLLAPVHLLPTVRQLVKMVFQKKYFVQPELAVPKVDRVLEVTSVKSLRKARNGALDLLILAHIDLTELWPKLSTVLKRCEIGRIALLKAWHVQPAQLTELRNRCRELFVDDIFAGDLGQDTNAASTALKLGCTLFPEPALQLEPLQEERLLTQAEAFHQFLTRGYEQLALKGR